MKKILTIAESACADDDFPCSHFQNVVVLTLENLIPYLAFLVTEEFVKKLKATNELSFASSLMVTLFYFSIIYV